MYWIPVLENRDTCIQALRDQISEIDKHLSPFREHFERTVFLFFHWLSSDRPLQFSWLLLNCKIEVLTDADDNSDPV